MTTSQCVSIGCACRSNLFPSERAILSARASDRVHEVSHRQTELNAVSDHVEIFDAVDDGECRILNRIANQASVEQIFERANGGDGVVSRARIVGAVDLCEVI